MTKRVLILNPDGTAEVGDVKVRVVRQSDIDFLPFHLRTDLLKDAAAIDLSGLPRVPDMPDLRYHGEYRRGFANALDAIGVKG